MNAFDRVKVFLGEEGYNKLKNSSVAVFGVGGVGGYVVEALARSGVGRIDVFDGDKVDVSNLNRQIIATRECLGKDKVEVVKSRALSINPDLKIDAKKVFYLKENADDYDLSKYDYIVDAVDTVSAKIELITRAKSLNVPILSCMGTGRKIHPEKLKVATIEKTSGCPLARVVRRELKNLGIKDIKVVYSDEQMQKSDKDVGEKADGKTAPASMIFVPATAGLIIAKEVVLDLIK